MFHIQHLFMAAATQKTKSFTKISLFKSGEESKLRRNRAVHVPAANIDETDSEYILTIAAPGFTKESFRINMEGNSLSVAASREPETAKCIHGRYEYDYRCWKRVFPLPENADALMTRARYENGELIIIIPKGKNDSSIFTHSVYVY